MREDFNRDNALIDAAIGGPGGAGGLAGALSGKLGHMEVIEIQKSNGQLVEVKGVSASKLPKIDWREWEYVGALAHYPGATREDPAIASFDFSSDGYTSLILKNLPMPGFLVVLFPQHDPQAKVAGFMLTDRFVPFSCDFPYEKLEWYGTAILQGPAYFPDVAWFGGK